MSSRYPAIIDSSLNLPTVQNNQTAVMASVVNKLRDAIVNVETELGVKPSGTNGTVRARFEVIEAALTEARNALKIQGVDVSSDSPTNTQVLAYNSSTQEWEPTTLASGSFTAGGDLSGTTSNQTVIGLQTIPVSNAAPNDTEVLTFNSGSGEWEPSASAGGPPSGSAGGNLSGSYPNPTVAQINGASVPAAGSLTTGHVLKVSGTSATTYGYVLNANVDASAAIAYSKLSLSNSILNADINASAAIAGTKISPNFGSQNLVSTGTLSLGTTPATSGSFRLANASAIIARDTGNTDNIQLLATDASDNIVIGDVDFITVSKSVRLIQDGDSACMAEDVIGSTTTSDDTETTAYTFTPDDDALTTVNAVVCAIEDDASNGASFNLLAVFKRTSGTITQIGTTRINAEDEDQDWAATIDFNGTSIRIRITGEAATNIIWGYRVGITRVLA